MSGSGGGSGQVRGQADGGVLGLEAGVGGGEDGRDRVVVGVGRPGERRAALMGGAAGVVELGHEAHHHGLAALLQAALEALAEQPQGRSARASSGSARARAGGWGVSLVAPRVWARVTATWGSA